MGNQRAPNAGQREPLFTKTEVALGTLLSIFIYTTLWALGVLVGLFLPVVLVLVLVIGLYVAPRMIQSSQLRPLATDISFSILVGLINKLVAVAAIEMVALPILSAILGGAVTGIVRRQYFPQYTNKKPIKYSFLSLLTLATFAAASVGVVSYYIRVDVPIENLRPPKVAQGWKLTDQGVGFRWTQVKYTKEHSYLKISGRRFGGSLKTKQEYRSEAEATMETIKPVGSLFGTDIGVTLTGEGATQFNGNTRYMFRYDFAHRGKGLSMGSMVQYFWYCDNLQTNLKATALIEHTPTQELMPEVQEMVGSLTCFPPS